MNNYQIQQRMDNLFGFGMFIIFIGFMVGMTYDLFGSYDNPTKLPMDKYRLVKRTKRGSLVAVYQEGDKAVIEVPNHEDMMDLSNLLNVSGIKWETRSGISKSAWEGTPVHLRTTIPSWHKITDPYPGKTVEFNFTDLEFVMSQMGRASLLLEEPKESINLQTEELSLSERRRLALSRYWYIKSKPPKEPYLYHHSYYSSLLKIARTHVIEAREDKLVISLTTDVGRFLSPLPFIVAVMVDGVVRIPYDERLQLLAVPCLYKTHNEKLVKEAVNRGHEVFYLKPPQEYKYIMNYIVKNDMFVNENEYSIIAPHLNLYGEDFYIHPSKLTRFRNSVPDFILPRIHSLEELARQ